MTNRNAVADRAGVVPTIAAGEGVEDLLNVNEGRLDRLDGCHEVDRTA